MQILGSRISLISKKNIRYEGTLYSINESDATVALENVKSFGTEGRELLDTTGASTFVPPQDIVHAYLLFRGQDIKDLHVHEKANEEKAVDEAPKDDAVAAKPKEEKKEPAPAAPAAKSAERKEKADKSKAEKPIAPSSYAGAAKSNAKPAEASAKESTQAQKKGTAPTPKRKEIMVGTGASLLNRKARGAKGDTALPEEAKGEFDFESNLAEFDKDDYENEEDDYEEEDNNVYSKNDFFDSISCDALDKASGVDNRLRGAAEGDLNIDTFGAVALGHGRRGGRGRGRGGRGGRGRGRGGRGKNIHQIDCLVLQSFYIVCACSQYCLLS